MAYYERIHLDNLKVNPANDRHGELPSETHAIEWLLVNKTEKMKNLLHDIAHKKGILEEPLVMKKGGSGQYIVYDGNRRVSCLKLLLGLAPEDIKNPLEKRIEALRLGGASNISPYIECRIEDDINIVNDILERRHIPRNSGAGQLKWDGHEKENFLERTGKTEKINFARQVNRLLIDNDFLNKSERIPLSTFNRLFQSKEAKRRVGVEVKENEIYLINDSDITYRALTRVAKDMISGHKTLDDVWDNSRKQAYLDDLENDGILPNAKNRLISSQPVNQKNNATKDLSLPKKPPLQPSQRDYLLPTDLPTPEQNEYFSYKFCTLFYELQNTLRFSKHLISMSLALRSFVELLTIAYLSKHGLAAKESFAMKIKSAFSHMAIAKKMPETTRAFVSKLDDENEFFSVNTLHKANHIDLQISDGDLRAFANNFDAYFREAIRSVNGKADPTT